jgi:hypothetical protein
VYHDRALARGFSLLNAYRFLELRLKNFDPAAAGAACGWAGVAGAAAGWGLEAELQAQAVLAAGVTGVVDSFIIRVVQLVILFGCYSVHATASPGRHQLCQVVPYAA